MMIITIVSILMLISLALFNQLLLYFSPRIRVTFRYDEGWSKQTSPPGSALFILWSLTYDFFRFVDGPQLGCREQD
jgi:hypothetical protein